VIWASLVGAAIGSIPTADAIARLSGHNLRTSGSGNPGTANALRVAGPATAATVLLLDLAKGACAAIAGWALAGTGGAALAGVAAVAGQVLNPWFGFKGGKGLGVAAGVTSVVWPPGLLLVLPVTAAGAKAFRAASVGAILGLATYLAGTVIWASNDLSTWWGIPPDDRLVWLAIGLTALTAPKFIGNIVNR
jgi:acyl phosphate:glycerol-3-phosphate acyltransferase